MLTERLRDALDRLAMQYETSPQLRTPCENGDAAGETGQEG
jgi:hypothetical protein